MKKTFAIILAFALCLTLLAIPVSAAADEGIAAFKVYMPKEDGTEGESVNWHYAEKDGKYYLFLPSSFDKENLTVAFTASGEVACGEETLVSGESTGVFSNGSATLTCGGKTYSVVVLDGGLTGSVFINTESGSLDAVHADKEYKEPGTIKITDETGASLYDGALEYIKGRGNSTWSAAKKPYNIKLDKKADLFGMGKSKKWCLLANAGDATLLRNQLSYTFAKAIGAETTSEVIPVGLYVNGNYMGAYSVTEKVEIGENRIDITDLEKLTEAVNSKPLNAYSPGGEQRNINKGTYQYVNIPNNPEVISGGYLLELEKVYRYINEDSGFVSNRGQAIVMKSPEEASQTQVEYMRAYYQEFEDALYSYTGYNAQGKHFTDYLDIDSVAAMYVAEEFGENFDGCSSSFFLYKDVAGKLMSGPAWDFDLTFSTNKRLNTLINRTTPLGDPQSLYIQHCFIDNYDESHKAFLAQLFTHEEFRQAVQRIWNENVKAYYPAFEAEIESAKARQASQATMNAIRWNVFGTTNTDSILSSYQARVNSLKSFAAERYGFLSNAYAQDTYFVCYDVGEDGGELVFDPTVYSAGAQASVAETPVSKDDEKHFLYWTTTPDGSGAHYQKGDAFTVNGNVNFYAQWQPHILQDADDGTQACTVCGASYLNGALAEDGWHGDCYYQNHRRVKGVAELPSADGQGKFWYSFTQDGHSLGKYTGVYNGYYYRDGVLAKSAGIVKFEGSYYFIGQRGQLYTGGTLTVAQEKTNGLLPPGTYTFDAEGKIILKQGIIDGYYYVDGTVKTGAGVIKYEGSYYYIGQRGQVYKGSSLYLNATMTNGLFPAGTYSFDADGKMILKQGIVDGFYYIDGVVQKGAGVLKIGNGYYYIGQRGQVYKGSSLFLNDNMTNGLFPAGVYSFDSDGKMILKQGIVDGFYYIDGVVQKSAGVVKIDNSYYYIGQRGQVYKGSSLYLNAEMTNGLFPAGVYSFDADGKMILKQGIVDGYYYIDGVVQKGAGVIKIGDSFYYIGQRGQVYKDSSLFLSASVTNGYLPAGKYMFDADGRILL